MKGFNLYYRICIYFTLALTVCHPIFQISAANALSTEEKASPKIVNGSLKNGLTFALIPSQQLKGGVWIKMDCAINQDEENHEISLLTQHALFYSTQKYSREALANSLNHLGLDVEADSFIQSNEEKQGLHFCLTDQQPEKIGELLKIMHQLAFQPTLKNDAIEWARNHMLSTLNIEKEEKAIALQSLTAQELRNFHSQWYSPEKIHLTLVGIDNTQEMATLLSEIFESPLNSMEEVSVKENSTRSQNDSEENTHSKLLDRVEWVTDHQTYVIDGKIWMKEPNWINNSSNGKTLGTLLTILGIGGMILAFPVAAPVAIIAGGLTTATGLYFCCSDYLKDPYYVERLRQSDLQEGCAYAYQTHRAGITLTPYERRALFLEEMVQHPQTLHHLPILLLADVYQLNDPVIAEIFTIDEFNILTCLKRDFVQKRNQYKLLKDELERELESLTFPYALARDASFLHAKDVYNQNYYVISKNQLKVARDISIEDVKKAFLDNQITLQQRDEMIDQAHAYYQACLSNPAFKAGLDAAESALLQMELEIQATYVYQVEICKQSIQYFARMEQIQLGQQAVINYFNQELTNVLATFPLYLTTLPDYLDLRSL